MRLRIIKHILETNISFLTIDASQRSTHTVSFLVNNSDIFRNAIAQIETTGLFSDIIDYIKQTDFYNGVSDSTIISQEELTELQSSANMLIPLIDNTIIVLDSLIRSESENIVSIKLPHPKYFKDISETTKKLDLIFNQTINQKDVSGTIEITNFDMGSFWIDVLVGGGAQAMHFVAALTWGGAVLYKKVQEGLLIKEQVRQLRISNDASEELNNKIHDSDSEVAQLEAQHIAETFYKDFSAEDVERIKYALEELAALYIKGAEIHPSLQAPQEIKKEFPNTKSIESIASKVKLISDPKNKKDKL